MHSYDRLWRWALWLARLLLIFPFLLACSAVAIEAFFLHLSPAHVLTIVDWSQIWPYVSLWLFAWTLPSLAKSGRQREQARAAALAGDLDAMLVSSIMPHPDKTPDLSREPLNLVWRTRRRPSGVVATDDGLTWRRPRKRDLTIPWADAKLFEVWRFDLQSTHTADYCLYGGAGAYIEWVDYTEEKAPHAADGAPFHEMQRRQRALLDAIAARTGLTPRTLAIELSKLAAESDAVVRNWEPDRPRGLRLLSLPGVLIVFAFTAILVAVGVAAILLPLTQSLPLNLYVAATIGGIGIFLLGFEVKVLADMVRDVAPVPPPAPPLFVSLPAAPLEDGSPVVLRFPRHWRGRLGAIAVGLILAGDAYAGVRTFIDYGSTVATDPQDLRHTVAAFLLVIVLIGIILCGMFAAERSQVVAADEVGLHWRKGKEHLTLPWEAITRLVAHASPSKVESFGAVGGDANLTTLKWPADGRWSALSGRGAQADAAGELAALVARHTGITLTIEEDS
jgi:hypothetical protein